MAIELPPLPYDYHALEPVISAAALKLHHGVHHRAYVTKLNALVAGSRLADLPLEELAKSTSVFGSGWAWLVQDGGTLKIVATANADTPIAHGQRPLLGLDYLRTLDDLRRRTNVTLLYGAADKARDNAAVLREMLEGEPR